MGKITMTVRADSHPEYGNIADFRLMLNGGLCIVNWGDGTTTTHHAEGEEQHIRHTYPEECIETGKTFVITISSDEDNIVGISTISESANMHVKDIDISGCQSLLYFAAGRIEHFDITTNPGIREVELETEACWIADFSNSRELKKLSLNYAFLGAPYDDILARIDLSKCCKLEILTCMHNLYMEIVLPKHSALKEFVYSETDFPRSSMRKIVRTIEQNKGRIKRHRRDSFVFRGNFGQLAQESFMPLKQSFSDTVNPVPQQIKMTVGTWGNDKFTGYAGNVNVLLDGGSCHIDWGDGHASELYANGTELLYGLHVYSPKCTSRQITITSDKENIIGIIADDDNSIYAHIEAIDISGCQSLKYFGTTSDNFDISTNPGIKAIDLVQMRCPSLDFSNSNELESLFIQSCLGGREKVQQLDLTKCNKLEYLACYCNSDLTDISVSDDSALMTLIYEMTPLSDSSLDRLRKVINRNGGEIRKLETEGSSLTKFIYDIETSATESRTEDTETKNE